MKKKKEYKYKPVEEKPRLYNQQELDVIKIALKQLAEKALEMKTEIEQNT